MRHQLLLTLAAGLLALPLLVAAGAGQISQPTELRATPHSDAASVRPLAAGTAVDVLQRQGGWYQVKAADAQGWVRMSSVQLAESATRTGSGASDALGFLRSGRSSATEATASTGVRGLDEAQLAKAEPDLGALAQVEGLAAKEADARQFAAQAPVQQTSVADLPGAQK
jgi:hypothetical protein